MHRHSLSTSNFKKEFVLLIKLVVMFLVVFIFAIKLSPQYLKGYQASIIDKVNRLESIDGPKIVLIGNSNLAFGINSDEIEETLNIPVVNMGLHGGLGNVFHERMALFNIQKGDIYIICHRTYDDYGIIEDPNLAWITLEDHFNLWKILRTEDIKPMVKAYPAYLKGCISLWLPGNGNQEPGYVYSRSAFNKYGDIEWMDNGLEFEFKEGDVPAPAISKNVIDRLNQLSSDLIEQGAILLIAGYPIADTSDRPSDDILITFQKELSKNMNAPVISDYTDYVYPTDYFFNASLHLNNKGKEARTQQLIEDLQTYYNLISD